MCSCRKQNIDKAGAWMWGLISDLKYLSISEASVFQNTLTFRTNKCFFIDTESFYDLNDNVA